MSKRTKPILILTLFPLLLASTAELPATDVSGDVWGTWSIADSPFYLVGDARVPPSMALVIEPGVEVFGMESCRLTVESDAVLTAVGTEDQPILFTADDPVAGWRGIRLAGANDATEISYSVLEFAKGTGPYPDVRGGALMIVECSPRVTFSEFRFSSSKNTNLNGTGGGICTENSEARILNNHVHDNEADSGGGICITEWGTPLVSGNLIENNTANNGGGGMYLGARSMPQIYNNVIRGNHSAGWGGGGINCWNSYIFYSTFPKIDNNIIVDNSTSAAGGGLYCRYDRSALTNNVVVGNSASRGGGIHVLNQVLSAPIVTNCIVWANTAPTGPQIDLEGSTGSEVIVNYCDVEGGWLTGTGNIDANPRFVPFPFRGYEYLLIPGSPCIDAGDPSLEDDFGWPEWYQNDSRSDMGAYGGPANGGWLSY